MVQQVLGEARDKWDSESPCIGTSPLNFEAANSLGTLGSAGGVGSRPGAINPNLPQTYYQLTHMGLGLHS
jgi:hypothetical protein